MDQRLDMAQKPGRNRKLIWFVGGGLLVALILAGVVSNFASSNPDGLDAATLQGCTVDAEGTITGGSCPAKEAQDHQLADGPLADYGIKGFENRFLSTGLSGVLGVLITFAIAGGIFWLVRRRGSSGTPDGREPDDREPDDREPSSAGTEAG